MAQPMQLGKYSLIRRLAVGGMAELFLARATGAHGFEKVVVLKRILPSFAQNPAFTQMFLAEARLAAALVHPNIAQVFDFGQHEGTYFFTMEYVQGRDLRQLIRAAQTKAKALPLPTVLQIITGMLAGLHHAHEQHDTEGNALEIVHRDVSPANALVTYEGNIKVVDFGIAKVAALGPATMAGNIKGKISYMSPEQCRAEPLDRRSDLFSVGIQLWEMTMGRRLFGKQAEGNQLSMLRLVDEANIPRPRDTVPHYPEQLEQIVLKALARDRAERYQSALEFRLALEDFAREERLPMSSAGTAIFMNELFPPEERKEPTARATGNFDGVPDIPPAPPTSPGPGELTSPERSFDEPTITPIGTNALLASSRRSIAPYVVSLGGLVVLLLLGGGYAMWGSMAPEPAIEPPSGESASPASAPASSQPQPSAPTSAPAAPSPELTPAPSSPETPEVAPKPQTKRRTKKKSAPPPVPEPKPEPEPEPEPKPKPKPKPKADDIFMVPDHDRGKGKAFE